MSKRDARPRRLVVALATAMVVAIGAISAPVSAAPRLPVHRTPTLRTGTRPLVRTQSLSGASMPARRRPLPAWPLSTTRSTNLVSTPSCTWRSTMP